jgi:NDP-sugar pyrophosphorylase family protein
MNAMVLAAGKGTRLRTLTESLPKPMLPVAGKPVLLHILEWLRRYQIRQVAINLHHRPEVIREYFGNGADFGLELAYSEEPELLGTAGGVKAMAEFFDDPFVVVYGDVLTDLDLGALLAFHRTRTSQPHATLAIDLRPDAAQCGIVATDAEERVREFIEKPLKIDIRSLWVNSGIMVLDRPLLEQIPTGRGCDFGRDVFPAWLRRGVPLFAWRLPEASYLIDMGTPEKLVQANREWPLRNNTGREGATDRS